MTSIAAACQGVMYFQAINQGKSQVVSIGGSSVKSSAFQAQTTIVRLISTQDCWISTGVNPTAVAGDADSFFLPAGIVDFFGVVGGQQLAVIQDSQAGSLYITEGA